MVVGVVRTHAVSASTSALLARIQSDLFTLGAELAGEFGVHITADQLLASGADLRQALP